jgi:trigger factor
MITDYIEESPTKKSISLEVPADDVKRATERAVRAIAKQVRLPGFRPGKVPPALVRKRFESEVKSEVLDTLIQETVAEALREKKLVPLGRPKIEDLKFELDAPLSFRVDLEVRPRVAPADFRGLKVPTEPTTPTDEEIDGVVGRIREGHATYEPIEGRPAMDGDFALVDVKGSFPYGDGQDFNADKQLVEIGGEETMPEMSAHLRNAEPGVTVSFQKDWPAEAPDSAFAGKSVLYSVSLIALKQRVMPALDDELAKLALTPRDGEAPEGANLAMLREKVKESLVREKEQALREKRRRAALDGLLALNPVDAPDSMVDAEVDSALREYARYAARQGVDLKEAQIDWNNLRNEARPSAVRRVKEYLLLDAIGDTEKVEVTDTELDAELKRRASAMDVTFSQLKAALVKNERLEAVREEVRIEKVLDFLLSEATAAPAP